MKAVYGFLLSVVVLLMMSCSKETPPNEGFFIRPERPMYTLDSGREITETSISSSLHFCEMRVGVFDSSDWSVDEVVEEIDRSFTRRFFLGSPTVHASSESELRVLVKPTLKMRVYPSKKEEYIVTDMNDCVFEYRFEGDFDVALSITELDSFSMPEDYK
jgi:hypothetical protein